MKKIYEVELTVKMIVAAEDEAQAEQEAKWHLDEASGEVEAADVSIDELDVRYLDRRDAEPKMLPWNGDGERTVAEYLTDPDDEDENYVDPRQMAMFPEESP